MVPLLQDECRLPVSRARFREIVLANRFGRLTGGRSWGNEDVSAHERKGIAGDWRNYFTGPVKQAFKARYGGLLVATGYERDLNW
jgi:lipopolysaccharide transport system ATP-binding protein